MVAAARQNIAAHGLAGRCEAIAGDIFAELPVGHDLLLLAWVLHDWSDANCERILTRCRAALAPQQGTLLISEAVLNDDGTGSDEAIFGGLNMLVNAEPGARERTLSEYRGLLEGSGLRLQRLVRTGGARDLIVADCA